MDFPFSNFFEFSFSYAIAIGIGFLFFILLMESSIRIAQCLGNGPFGQLGILTLMLFVFVVGILLIIYSNPALAQKINSYIFLYYMGGG